MTRKLLHKTKFLLTLLGCFFLIAFVTETKAQTVTGTVLSAADNQPLNGVTVTLEGSAHATTTDPSGNYRITQVPSGSSLTFSYVGFKTQTIAVGGRSKIDVSLQAEAASLDQVVVIGYGSVKKIDMTGSVGYVNVTDMAKAPVPSFASALAGRVAGVQVNASDGQPGGGINIMIRGAGSLTQSTTPLYVVDGFPIENLDPATINPEDIESISILKDASSTAIYGSRGANGVVLIQTKRGKPGRAVVSLTGSLGYQLPPKSIPMMSPYEFVKYQQELDPTSYATPIYFAQGKTLDDYKNEKGINWQDQVIQTGIMQTYNLAIRGGTDQTKYSISGNIFDQKGVIINTGTSRYAGRVSVDQTISEKIKAGITTDYTETDTYGQVVRSLYTSNATASALVRAWMYRPISADPDEDLLTDPGDVSIITPSDFRINPVIDLENQYQHTINDILKANAYVSYDITKHLTFKSQAGIMQIKTRNEQFYNSKTSQGSPINPNNTNGVWGYLSMTDARSFSNENTLNYNQTFGNGHTLKGLLLFGVNSYKSFNTNFRGTNLPNEAKRMDGLDESTTSSFTSPDIDNTINTMASYAARVDYNYQSKYLVTVNFRADGSSKFFDHWGYFPSGAVAWNMDQENFFRNALPFISNSKLRVSYGETGNNRVGDFAAYPTLVLNNSGQGYSFNNGVPTAGAYLSSLGNSKLKWEKTKQLDIGYEFGVLDNRISLEVDLYRRNTENLLLAAKLPTSSGFSSATENVGKLRNDGIEFTLNTTNVTTGSFSWTSNFNISFNRNKIISLTYGQPSLSNTVTYLSQFGQPLYLHEIGKPIGMMIGYVWEGNYQYADFDNPAPDVYVLKANVPDNGTSRNTVQPGDIKLKDLNGDGTVNSKDLTIIGRGQPIHIGGFNNNFTYKGFSLNLFFQWSYGNNLYNANRLLLEGNSNGFHGINQYASYANRWSPENQTNENYRTRGQGFIGYFSSKNLEDGSYLRLKTAALAYSLPARLIKKLYLSNLTVDVSAQNLITWTKYSGLDPEVSVANNVLQPGYDFSGYPNAKTIVFGLKASF
jgi:TonB-linked SusC/RagA family outer membrane protein